MKAGLDHLAVGMVPDHFPGLLAQGDKAGLGLGGGDRRLRDTGAVHDAFPALVHAAKAHQHDRTGPHADAHLQAMVDRVAEAFQGVLDAQTAQGGLFRRQPQLTLVGLGPVGQQGVAGEFDDIAAVIVNDVDEAAEVRVQYLCEFLDPLGALGGEFFAQRGEAGNVGEQHGGVQPLGKGRVERRRRLGDAALQELGNEASQSLGFVKWCHRASTRRDGSITG